MPTGRACLVPALIEKCATANPAPAACSCPQRKSMRRAAVGIARRQTLTLLLLFRPRAQGLSRHRCLLQLPFPPRPAEQLCCGPWTEKRCLMLQEPAPGASDTELSTVAAGKRPVGHLLCSCQDFLVERCTFWFALSLLVRLCNRRPL